MRLLSIIAILVVPLTFWLGQKGNLRTVKPYIEPVLQLLPFYRGARPELINKHIALADGPNFGDEGCEVKFEGIADACEDGQFHYPSHQAFWACSTIQSRETFWPPQRLWDRTTHREQDYVVKYDAKTGQLTRLKTPDYDGDIVTHGFGLWSSPKDPNTVYIHLINHKTHPQSCVTIFKHTIGTDFMNFVEDNCDPMIVSPNDVAPTGPTSFYMANAHRFNSHGRGGLQQVLVQIEDELGPWQFTNVIYCGGAGSKCKEAASGHVGANGVLLVGDLLYVDDWPGAFVTVYRRMADNRLAKLEEIPLGSPVDNLSYDPVADALLAATFPSVPSFFHHYLHPWTNKYAAITVTRIKREKDPRPGFTKHKASIVMFSNNLTGSISTVLSDSELGVTVIGGIKNTGLVICPRSMALDDKGIPA